MPIVDCLLGAGGRSVAAETLDEGTIADAGLFDLPKVKRLLAKLRVVERPGEIDSMALAGIVSSQIIWQQFVAGFPREERGTAPARSGRGQAVEKDHACGKRVPRLSAWEVR